MHKPLKTNGQSQGDILAPEDSPWLLPWWREDGHGLLAETDALPRAHICLEEWMERSDGETLASFKSHAWWAFLKCNAGLIINAPHLP